MVLLNYCKRATEIAACGGETEACRKTRTSSTQIVAVTMEDSPALPQASFKPRQAFHVRALLELGLRFQRSPTDLCALLRCSVDIHQWHARH